MDDPSSRHGNEQQKRDGRGKGAIEREIEKGDIIEVVEHLV